MLDVDPDHQPSSAAARGRDEFRPEPSGKAARTLTTSRGPVQSPEAISQSSTPPPMATPMASGRTSEL
eukprot:2667566-Prorocentrum_lima.AAC.1